MLWTNLRNQVRQTPLPKWKPLIPLFEAVMNSFQAIRDAGRPKGAGSIVIDVDRDAVLAELLLEGESPPICGFRISDNGVGLTDANFDSFNTAFSDYKLSRGGKGLGRFTWLKAFDRIEIDSVFNEANASTSLQRKFVFDENYDLDKRGVPVPAGDRPTGTSVHLIGFREPYKSECPRNADQIVQRLVEHFLLIFLEPDCPKVSVRDKGLHFSANEIFETDFRTSATVHEFAIRDVPFTLHGFRLGTPRVSKHKLVYAANQRGVLSDDLGDYVPNLKGRLPDGEGASFVYLAIVQSPYLTQRVNPARTDFDLGVTEDADLDQRDLFPEEVGRPEIRDEGIRLIQRDLAGIIRTINEAKEERIRNFVQAEAPQYKILIKYSDEYIDKLPPNPSKMEIDATLHRELYQRETQLKAEGARIIKEAEKVDDYEAYQQRLTEFMERYNELGVSALAQYVGHRKIILEFLERAISLQPGEERYPLERAVHQLVFPMRGTSDDIPYHEQNLWIIDEKLTFHSFIASDKRLSSLETMDSDSGKRPDLLIYDEKIVFGEGEQPANSITIVEFKRPQRDDYTASDNPVTQAIELVEQIKAGAFKTKGRPISVANEKIPAFCYSICDLTSSLRKVLEDLDAYTTPDGQGYYGFHRRYGIYWEVIDYNKLLRDAQKRNRVFFEKLNLV